MCNSPGQLDLEEGNLFCFFFNPENEENKPQEPTSFADAWNHQDPSQKSKWRDGICLEFNQMLKNGVWNRKGEDKLPADRKGIGTKWVFKIKKDGTYRARLVAKGYNQIAGVDFQHNFAPVTNEVTLRILLMTWIVKDLYAEVGDVQTAFLHGDLEEELFLKFPDGYKEYLKGNFLWLNKSIYGLVEEIYHFLVKQVGFE